MITSSLVLYNTKNSDLESVLSSVLPSAIDKLYIIDNSETDKVSSIIKQKQSPKIEYIFGHGNIGFGAGNNIGIQRAFKENAKYHVVLNPDIIFEPKIIEELATYMDNNPEVGQILPRVEYPDGRLQYLCKLLPSPFDIFARRLLPKSLNKRNNYKFEMRFTGYDKIWNCPILSGCFMFLDVKTLREVGMFDSRFFMYFEDFDLMRRIHEISQTIFYPYVKIIHNHASEHRKNNFLLRQSMKSAIMYFNKWGWFFDKNRKKINNSAIKSGYIPNK